MILHAGSIVSGLRTSKRLIVKVNTSYMVYEAKTGLSSVGSGLSMSLNNSIHETRDYFQNVSFVDSEEFNVSATTQPRAPMYIVFTATIFYVLIFILGVSGNVIVVTVVSLVRAMKTTMNIYLVNLCIADLLVLVLCMPTALAEIFTMEAWLFGEIMCK